MFLICLLGICLPLILAVDLLNEPLGQQTLEVAHQDDVVLAVEVDPAVVTLLGVLALSLARLAAIEDLVECLFVDIA